MSAGIKICGVTRTADIDALNACQVDMVGFNFFKPSPRAITQDVAAQLAAQCRPQMARVALLVDPQDHEIEEALAAVSPHYIQLHGSETPDRLAEIKSRSHCAVIKALAVETAADLARAATYEAADMFLFDAKPPRDTDAALPGGNGVAFDWTLLGDYDHTKPYLLAGGLKHDNIAEALSVTKAPMVDIASGVETEPGHKSPQLIEELVAAVRAAA